MRACRRWTASARGPDAQAPAAQSSTRSPSLRQAPARPAHQHTGTAPPVGRARIPARQTSIASVSGRPARPLARLLRSETGVKSGHRPVQGPPALRQRIANTGTALASNLWTARGHGRSVRRTVATSVSQCRSPRRGEAPRAPRGTATPLHARPAKMHALQTPTALASGQRARRAARAPRKGSGSRRWRSPAPVRRALRHRTASTARTCALNRMSTAWGIGLLAQKPASRQASGSGTRRRRRPASVGRVPWPRTVRAARTTAPT